MRRPGILKAILKAMDEDNGSQLKPWTYEDLAHAAGLDAKSVATALASAHRSGLYPRLRRTVSRTNARSHDYWLDTEDSPPKTLQEAHKAVSEAQQALVQAIASLVALASAQKPALTAEQEAALRGLLRVDGDAP